MMGQFLGRLMPPLSRLGWMNTREVVVWWREFYGREANTTGRVATRHGTDKRTERLGTERHGTARNDTAKSAVSVFLSSRAWRVFFAPAAHSLVTFLPPALPQSPLSLWSGIRPSHGGRTLRHFDALKHQDIITGWSIEAFIGDEIEFRADPSLR